MPNRWVREDAIESETVNSASWQAEVFWRRLLNRCDDFGRFTANLTLLRTKIFPLQMDKVSEADVARLLSECERIGLLFTYKGPDGKPYLVLNKFERGRAKYSKYPDPPPDVCARMQAFEYKCEQVQTNAPIPTSDPDTRLPNTDSESVNAPARDAVPIPKSVEEVNSYGLMQAIKPEICQKFWDDMEADGWMNKYGRIWPDWRARLRSYSTTWRSNESRTGTTSGPGGSKPKSIQDLRVAREATERIATGLKNRWCSETAGGGESWEDPQKKEMWREKLRELKSIDQQINAHLGKTS